MNLAGVVGARDERRIWYLVVTGGEKEGGGFRYSRTDTGDARVGG